MITKGIFGAPLKSASLCGSCNSFGLTVPDPVYRCFEEIMKRDFDKPPTYGKYIDLKDYDIHAITGVVKKYLRQLPDPVIPIACHEEFIQLYDRSFSKKSTINSLALKIQQLPREHFHLIHYIIIMSSLIQKHSNINMMNPEALAVVLAPVCTGLEHNLKEIPSWVKRHTRTKMMNDMGQFIETNTKWTQIWTLLIEYSDTLLELWKDSSLLWQVVVSPPGRNTVPCHPSSSSSYLNEHNNASSPPLHPSRHSTNLSPIQQTELLLDIVPPYNKPQRRPSHHSHKSSDELYKVVIMRTRQNTTCKSLKNTIKRSSALLDSSSYHQYYAAPTTLVHSNSTSTSRISSSTRTSAIVHPSNTSLFSSKSSVTTASD
ncbi:Rho GTPase activation protein [Thamnidium elegans]|nr:Rho GTPase activation protein [Thamnidium elegans]